MNTSSICCTDETRPGSKSARPRTLLGAETETETGAASLSFGIASFWSYYTGFSVGSRFHTYRAASNHLALALPRFPRRLALEIRPQGGRPIIDAELRDLIRRISKETPLWGAPRVHGELSLLGYKVS